MCSCRYLLLGMTIFYRYAASELTRLYSFLVGQIPHSLIIQKVRPSIWLPLMILAWAGFTMASAACKNFEQLGVLRFFLGFAEASTYAGSVYIMGSW